MKAAIALPAAALLFAVLATANSGGYRYGASDQAFYGPALAKAVDPALFPRDSAVLAPQMKVWLGDDVLAGVARTFSLDQPALFAGVYVVTIAALFLAAVWFARSLGGSWLMTAAFVTLLTFRHRIAKTGANSLEGYMHPRMLAFAVGLGALACVLKRRDPGAIALVALAFVIHPTTAGWFGIAVVVAIASRFVPFRWLAIAIGATAVAALAALLAGPLAERLQIMDAAWLAVFSEKDYLFPSEWPLYAWATNLAYPLVLWLVYRQRRAAGALVPGETSLLIGLGVLVDIFLVSVPLTAGRIAFVVQFQVNRIFWLLDAVTAAYLAWWIVDWLAARQPARIRTAVVGALALLSAARGFYVLRVETGRPLVEYRLPASDWTDGMNWLRGQPASWHVLADPGHGWKYGSSVRLAALKDTLLESGKDTSMAMYDREVALRVVDRAAALADFDRMTTSDVRRLDERFALDAVIAEAGRALELPVLYRNRQFVIYDLR